MNFNKGVMQWVLQLKMFHNTTLHLLNNPEKMLRSLNNNTSAFSMENLLSREKLSPENLEIIDRNAEDIDRSSLENFRLNQSDKKPSSSPSETTRSEGENDRLSPVISPEKNDLFLRFNNCFKNSGICSSCGRLDCNFFQCRMNDVNVVKDNKPVLKFSVSAILGTENQPKHIQNGKFRFRMVLTHTIIGGLRFFKHIRANFKGISTKFDLNRSFNILIALNLSDTPWISILINPFRISQKICCKMLEKLKTYLRYSRLKACYQSVLP